MMDVLPADANTSHASRMRDAGPVACLVLLLTGLACCRFCCNGRFAA